MKNKLIVISIILLMGIAIGRFLSPDKVKTETRVVEVEKIVEKVVRQTVTILEKPDGTKETVIVTDSNTSSKTNEQSTNAIKEVTGSKDRINVSVLAGSSFPLNLSSPIYGLSANKNILGPISAGVWGLSNKTFGVSLGLNL